MKGLKLAGAASVPLLIVLLVGAPSSADAKGPKGPGDIAGINEVVPRIGHHGVGVGLANSHSSHNPGVRHNAITNPAAILPSFDVKGNKKSALDIADGKGTSASKNQESSRSDSRPETEAAGSPSAPSSAKRAPLPACI